MTTQAASRPGPMMEGWHRDPAALGDGLQRWARAHVDAAARVTGARFPLTAGASTDTLLFELDAPGPVSGPLVARLSPATPGDALFDVYAVERQVAVMRIAREHADVPVPEVHWHEPDPAWLGADFYVMEQIDGVPATSSPVPYVEDGWVLEATDAQRAAMDEAAAGLLAGIHRISPAEVDLSAVEPGAERGAALLRRQLERQRAYYDWTRGEARSELIDALFETLAASVPDLPDVLCWGDSRIGNVLWREHRPVAVLDWEMALVAPRECDLGWMIFFHEYFQDQAEKRGKPGLRGFQQRATLVDAYTRASGHTPVELVWFERFAALRFAIIIARIVLRAAEKGAIARPPTLDGTISYADLIRRMLDGSHFEEA
jgi:aminoglycoside phosphotransferase (APT) family kinase protein